MMHVLLLFLLSLFSHSSYAGFSPETVVLAQQNFIPIKQLHKGSVIIGYGEINSGSVDGTVDCCTTHRTSLACKVICDNDISFIASPNQIVKRENSWCAVKHLKPRNRLWCYQNAYVIVQEVQIITQETELIEISVEPTHTFFVTSAKILAHNHPAIMITAAPLLTSIVPAAAKAVGILGVAGAALYSLFAKNSGQQKSHNSHHSSSSCSPPPPEDPRNKTKYENMEQVFERAPMGRKLEKVVRRTDFNYKGSKIYQVIEDVEEWGIKKGDWLYLDRMHYDHIEVFNRSGKALRTVLNMDGTPNAAKIKNAAKRNIRQWIN